MQADAYFAACETGYAATFRAGRTIYALDVPQLTPEEAAAALRPSSMDSPRPVVVHERKPRHRDPVEEMRAYAQRMRERALARSAARA